MITSSRQIIIENVKYKLRHKKILNFIQQSNAIEKIKIARTLAYGSPIYENL